MQLFYKYDVNNSVRMIGANSSDFDEEKELGVIARKSFYPFEDQKLPTDFHDKEKGCSIVSFICSLTRFVQKNMDRSDLLDLYIAFWDNCGLFYTQEFPDEEGNDVLYASITKITQVF